MPTNPRRKSNPRLEEFQEQYNLVYLKKQSNCWKEFKIHNIILKIFPKDLFDWDHKFVIFDIVSRCFENKNNCCETKICKNAVCLLFKNPFLATLRLGCPGSRMARLWMCKFVNNEQVAFLQIFVWQQLLFLFSKRLNTMSNVTDCDPGQTNLWFSCSKFPYLEDKRAGNSKLGERVIASPRRISGAI